MTTWIRRSQPTTTPAWLREGTWRKRSDGFVVFEGGAVAQLDFTLLASGFLGLSAVTGSRSAKRCGRRPDGFIVFHDRG